MNLFDKYSPNKKNTEIRVGTVEENFVLEEQPSREIVFKSASEILEDSKLSQPISTGVSGLNQLLHGGIERGSITEVFGSPTVGKSQFAFQITKNNSLGKYKPISIFIDTEGTFKPQRIVQMLKHQKASQSSTKDVLDNIMVFSVSNYKDQIKVVQSIFQMPNLENVGLIVIDSLTNLFRAQLSSKSQIIRRQQLINLQLSKLRSLAQRNKIAVLVTNQVGMDYQAQRNIPVGGNILAHGVTHRLQIERMDGGNKRLFKIVSSPFIPEGVIELRLTEQGLI